MIPSCYCYYYWLTSTVCLVYHFLFSLFVQNTQYTKQPPVALVNNNKRINTQNGDCDGDWFDLKLSSPFSFFLSLSLSLLDQLPSCFFFCSPASTHRQKTTHYFPSYDNDDDDDDQVGHHHHHFKVRHCSTSLRQIIRCCCYYLLLNAQ